jgi:hypothetical protein
LTFFNFLSTIPLPMKYIQGFIHPIAMLLATGVLITTAMTGAIFIQYKNTNNKPSTRISVNKITPTVIQPSSSPTPTLKPTTGPIPTKKPVQNTTTTGSINANISLDNKQSNDQVFEYVFRNETTGQEKRIHNETSSLKTSSLNPGRYNITILFPQDRFSYSSRECDNCGTSTGFSDWGKCGYEVNLQAGQTINFICKLRTSRIINLPVPNSNNGSNQPDTNPPQTNIFYPLPNGTITYKTDGKVCASMSEPIDNAGSQGVETQYKFDNGGWQKGIGYLCTESLSNGPHSLSFFSKDKAGNVEAVRTINFTVNIPGN